MFHFIEFTNCFFSHHALVWLCFGAIMPEFVICVDTFHWIWRKREVEVSFIMKNALILSIKSGDWVRACFDCYTCIHISLESIADSTKCEFAHLWRNIGAQYFSFFLLLFIWYTVALAFILFTLPHKHTHIHAYHAVQLYGVAIANGKDLKCG